MKGDDDILVIPRNVAKTISDLQKSAIGCLKTKEPVNRNIESKYFMPDDLVDKAVYPTYFSGASYLMSQDMVRKIYEVVPNQPIIPLDDTYIGKFYNKFLFIFEKYSCAFQHFLKR